MKQKFYIILFVLCAISNQIQAQNSSINELQEKKTKSNNLFINAGAIIPISVDVSDVYSLGYNLAVGISLNVYKKKLFIEPSFSFSGFQKEIINSIKENTNFICVSLPLALKILPNKTNNSLVVLGSIDYNYINNYFSSTNDDTNENMMKGNGLSACIGIRYNFISWLAIEANYCYMPMNLTLSDDIYELYETNGIIVSKTNKFDFSQLKITLKYSFLKF